MISLEILRKRRKSEKIKRHRLLLLISIVLCVNGLSVKNQWYKYFHLGELPEFNRPVLEVLRQPLEDRKITISRAKYTIDYPASFMFVASMNPCPCGYYGDPTHHCVCTPGQIQRYMNKISGPLLDRIDIHCENQAVPFAQLSQMQPREPSAVIRECVIRARTIADLAGSEKVQSMHIAEAIGYRNLDRGDWTERGL